ncbi:TBC domain protein [Drechmeria coniospora]|uniref:TBC domain protein n=1 Tax=Drechmeria coniospora TaxID=98403 RepID=A0A151GX61_DRECN|nr:TBC domain protein [Drechmeria coniospora]KYK61694.1 TBC domain protein [Drechmeria coniospora]
MREQGTAISSAVLMRPCSPPGMTTSKSSKSSSFRSLNSDDGSDLVDASHFEDIGLDDAVTLKSSSGSLAVRTNPTPLAIPSPGRNIAAKRTAKPRRSFPNLHSAVYASNPRSTSVTGLSDPRSIVLTKNLSTSLPFVPRRHRSTSPAQTLNPRVPSKPSRQRRGSWQVNRDRRSLQEIEHDCDEDDGDDIPDGIILDNVPISPRPASERPSSRGTSLSPSPDGAPKERVRSVGNGTPPVSQAHGSLRSPARRAEGVDRNSPLPAPIRTRTLSWNAAHAELSDEAKALTEKLEQHADEEVVQHARRPTIPGRPNTWNSSQSPLDHFYDKKERVKSSTPELPPLRRSNIMVDPLPISKEKEAVLSRTRPSWLPPKDRAEEKRHLKEYQRMMVASAKADERREAARQSKTESRDANANSSMHIWENDILPRWNEAIRERKTRDLWWKGIAPRSRGAVWTRAVGNELGLSGTTFRTALARAHDLEARVKTGRGDSEDVRRAKWFEQIRHDAGDKTWRDLRIFQISGPLHQALVDVLSAYAMYRNDIGYVLGCNTVAALLLLNFPDPEAVFVTLANLLNRPLLLSFYTSDQAAQTAAFNLVLQKLSRSSAALYNHLTQTVQDLDPKLYLRDLFVSMFTSYLGVDEAARLWDVYVFEGDPLLVRAAVAVLLSHEMALLGSRTAAEVRAVMSKAEAKSWTGAAGEIGAEERFMQAVRDAGHP